MVRSRSETEYRFHEISLSNEIFGFLKPQALLRSEGFARDMNKLKNMYAGGIDHFKSSVETALCNRLVQSTGTTFSSDATELNLIQ